MNSNEHLIFLPGHWQIIYADIILLCIATIGTAIILRHWRTLKKANAHIGFALMLAGLWSIMGPYIYDLSLQMIAPYWVDTQTLSQFSERVHEQFRWYLTTLGTVLILGGLMKATINLNDQLRKTSSDAQIIRSNENLLNAIFQSVPVALLIKNKDHVIERVNDTYLEWYDLDRDIVVGSRSEFLRHFRQEDDANLMNAQEDQVLRTGITQRRRVQRPKIDSDEDRYIEITKFPIFDVDGSTVGIGSVSLDITEQLMAQRTISAALHEARLANKAKSEFLATMSHEFRTPLNAILGFSEFLQTESHGPLGAAKYKEYVNDIFSSGNHMLSLVNDALDISAIEAGKREIVKESIDLATLFRECTDQLAPSAEVKSLNLGIEIPDNFQPLNADHRALTQIMLNLLSNAIKFTPIFGTITIKAVALDKEIEISVIDTGQGIPDDKIDLVSEPFAKIETDPHITQDGSGLGLSIVKSLVSLHNGRFEIESSLGVGTRVSVIFPAI